ncbi:MAG TPA: SusC/RagA family TonB-linked outer membrane protein, partial [Segetibacter sp.]
MRKSYSLMLGILFLCTQLLAQNRTLTGRITDEAGSPISNATILVKGAQTGTASAADGSFTLNVKEDVRTIVVSGVNYTTQEIPIGKTASFITAQMKAAAGSLAEVIVVGYGTQKKSDMTSAITKVSGDKLANVPLTSVDQILQGKVAGLQSTTFSGQPGSAQPVRIRGIGSYSASSQPLYVVDGIQINAGELTRLATTSNVLANINPDDIESVSVLKDAAATAIYGSRGGNGVIVITTKRGKAGKTQFKATAEVGVNKLGNIPDAARPLRSADWLMLLKESYVNAGFTQAQADALAATNGDGSVDTDWEKLVTRSGAQKQYNLSAQGGDGKTNFYVSGGYFKQEAATIGADLTRVSSLIKLEHNVSRKLSFSLNLQPTYTRQNTPLTNSAYWANPVTAMFFLRPTQNPFNADGSYNVNTSVFGGPYNVLQTTANDVKSLNTVQAISGGQVKYSILNNLDFTSKLGLQYNVLEEYRYDNPFHGDGLGSNGRGFAYNTRYFLYDWVNQLDYRFNVTKDNSITGDARIAYEAISSKGYQLSAAAQNFPTLHEALPYSTVAATVTDGRANISDYSFSSVFANANLSYRGKYIVGVNFRRDGSSRFSQNNLYGNFPSASVAWNVSKENFMSGIHFISDVKIRASYGSSGNAEIGNYTWRELVAYGTTTNYNGQPGGTYSSLGNRNLTWEKNK